MDYSPPGSSVHGISQARMLERLPFPSPRHLPDPGIDSISPALAGGFFTIEPPGKPIGYLKYLKCYQTTRDIFFFFFVDPVVRTLKHDADPREAKFS